LPPDLIEELREVSVHSWLVLQRSRWPPPAGEISQNIDFPESPRSSIGPIIAHSQIGAQEMAFPPNYNQDRNQRARAKARKALEKQLKREEKSAQRKQDRPEPANESASAVEEKEQT
jgi:hypothetical protein